jgi:hypothetical protein
MNYAALKNLVAFYVHRTDLDSLMDDFKDLATEKIMIRAQLIALEVRASITFSSALEPLPTDWWAFKSVRAHVRGGVRPIAPYTKGQLDELTFGSTGSDPIGYAIDGGIEIAPFVAGQVIDFTYYRQPTLVADEDENAVLTKHPSLYLQAMMSAAHQVLQDTESMRVSDGEFDIALEGALNYDKFAAMSGGAPQMTPG